LDASNAPIEERLVREKKKEKRSIGIVFCTYFLKATTVITLAFYRSVCGLDVCLAQELRAGRSRRHPGATV
jgi:hypothetical protein